jgi:hypothetical protein
MSTLTQVVNVRGVIYQKLNIGCQIANGWIHQRGKVYFSRKEYEGFWPLGVAEPPSWPILERSFFLSV